MLSCTGYYKQLDITFNERIIKDLNNARVLNQRYALYMLMLYSYSFISNESQELQERDPAA